MPKNPYWDEYHKPHAISFTEVIDDCFGIFSVVRASASLQGTLETEATCSFDEVFEAGAEPELSQRLLRVAIMMRTYDDFIRETEYSERYLGVLAKIEEWAIGNWYLPDEGDLSFREACNKIIHSTDVRPVYDNGKNPREEPHRWGMTGDVELRGQRHGKEWTVSIDIFNFLDACLFIANLDGQIEAEVGGS